jgi:N-acetylglucosamine-6-phosphate deacetylase
VRVSVAHTCASYEEAAAAFEAGARHVTHLFNAMPGLHHRAPGPVAAAAEQPWVTPELICDGIHVHPAMGRLAFSLFGTNRMLFVSDSMRACGLADGTYDLGGQQVCVRGPLATLADGTIAGSVTDLMGCLRWAVREANIPLVDAVRAASTNPARALGLAGQRGTLTPGTVADAVVLDKETLEVKHVVLRGRLLV